MNGISIKETVSADGDKITDKNNDENHQHEKTENGDITEGGKNEEKALGTANATTGATEATISPAWSNKQSNRTREETEEAALVSISTAC